MITVFKTILYIIIFVVAIVFIKTGFITDYTNYYDDTNTTQTQTEEDNSDYVSVVDVFDELKSDLSDNNSRPKTYNRCKKEGNIEYVKEGKMCRTSTEHIITCKDGKVIVENGLTGKEIRIKTNNAVFKCEE